MYSPSNDVVALLIDNSRGHQGFFNTTARLLQDIHFVPSLVVVGRVNWEHLLQNQVMSVNILIGDM